MDVDAWALRYFSSPDDCFDDEYSNGPMFNGSNRGSKRMKRMPGLEILVSQSFGKNMGLYGERIGFLCGVVNDASVITNIKSQLSLIIRPMYSNPGGHGAKIVGKILSSPILYKEWKDELKSNVERLKVRGPSIRSLFLYIIVLRI